MVFEFLPVLVFILSSFSSLGTNADENNYNVTTSNSIVTSNNAVDLNPEITYENLDPNSYVLPQLECFSEAMKGYCLLKEKGLVQKEILTLIDFSLSSNTKRLWVIDLKTNTILFHSLVAHGRNTGDEYASRFSNAAESNKSSLGFYATGEIYKGKHGVSMRLDGLEKGVNDNARGRGVVMHAADYVSDSFIKNHQRLGRSQGCPAIPNALTKDIINTIKDKSCLFIYHPSRTVKDSIALAS